MKISKDFASYTQVPNLYIEKNGRRLAYRSLGEGKPIILCTRFRGNMDLWDPKFIDSLVGHGFRVITFDYTGLGLSSGEKSYNPGVMLRDPVDIIESLALENVTILGWSLGGLVAQLVLATQPKHLSHVVLIGTAPPGANTKNGEQIFYDTARKPVNDLEDEIILFFDPSSAASKVAASASHERMTVRTEGLSEAIPWQWAGECLGTAPKNESFPAPQVLEVLRTTELPVLHIGGDHDIVFPVENWYALNPQLPTTRLLTFPSTGHGPQHQYPCEAADAIASFVRNA